MTVNDICVRYYQLRTHIQVHLYLGDVGYLYDYAFSVCRRHYTVEFRDGKDINQFFPRLQLMRSEQLHIIYDRMHDSWTNENTMILALQERQEALQRSFNNAVLDRLDELDRERI